MPHSYCTYHLDCKSREVTKIQKHMEESLVTATLQKQILTVLTLKNAKKMEDFTKISLSIKKVFQHYATIISLLGRFCWSKFI